MAHVQITDKNKAGSTPLSMNLAVPTLNAPGTEQHKVEKDLTCAAVCVAMAGIVWLLTWDTLVQNNNALIYMLGISLFLVTIPSIVSRRYVRGSLSGVNRHSGFPWVFCCWGHA